MVVFTFLGARRGVPRRRPHRRGRCCTDALPTRACSAAGGVLVDVLMLIVCAVPRWSTARSCAIGTMGQTHRRVALAAGGRDLPADPAGQLAHAAVRARTHLCSARRPRAVGDVRRPRRRDRGSAPDGRARAARQLLRADDAWACRWPMRWAWRRWSARWWIDMPLDAVMIQIASGVNKFSLLAIPFFVLAGAIMAEGGMARRLVAFAGVLVGFMRGGLSLVNILASHLLRRDLGLVGGRHRVDRLGADPARWRRRAIRATSPPPSRSAARCRRSLIPPSHNAVIYSLAAGGTVSDRGAVHGRRAARAAARPDADRACACASRTSSTYPKGEPIPLQRGAEDRAPRRCGA